ncbi:CLUMA_CG007117, isoform A [Clunio marinus]|uniref:CLUMA_CG007117, isoform A n=1 Tax=Clunio marinus TaxID=568069 RepID=A0A1J1HZQ3_9DIPT|nr:CLUMA_CG007117, isoform A [Clunio marinus]
MRLLLPFIIFSQTTAMLYDKLNISQYWRQFDENFPNLFFGNLRSMRLSFLFWFNDNYCDEEDLT